MSHPINSHIKILLAEDNQTNQMVATLLLKNMGYSDVQVANNGKEAVDMCAASNYDLVLMDMKMPKMGGIEATKIILQRPTELRPTVVGLTGGVFEGDRDQCIECGMIDVITKPIDPETFKAVLAATPCKFSKTMTALPPLSRENVEAIEKDSMREEEAGVTILSTEGAPGTPQLSSDIVVAGEESSIVTLLKHWGLPLLLVIALMLFKFLRKRRQS